VRKEKGATLTCECVYLVFWKTYAWHLGALVPFSTEFRAHSAYLATFFQLLGKRKRFSSISFSALAFLAPFGILQHSPRPANGSPHVCEWVCGKCFSIPSSSGGFRFRAGFQRSRRKVHKFSVLFAPASAC